MASVFAHGALVGIGNSGGDPSRKVDLLADVVRQIISTTPRGAMRMMSAGLMVRYLKNAHGFDHAAANRLYSQIRKGAPLHADWTRAFNEGRFEQRLGRAGEGTDAVMAPLGKKAAAVAPSYKSARKAAAVAAAAARNPSPAGAERGPEGAGVAAWVTGLLPPPPPAADPSELWMLSAFNNDESSMGARVVDEFAAASDGGPVAVPAGGPLDPLFGSRCDEGDRGASPAPKQRPLQPLPAQPLGGGVDGVGGVGVAVGGCDLPFPFAPARGVKRAASDGTPSPRGTDSVPSCDGVWMFSDLGFCAEPPLAVTSTAAIAPFESLMPAPLDSPLGAPLRPFGPEALDLPDDLFFEFSRAADDAECLGII